MDRYVYKAIAIPNIIIHTSAVAGVDGYFSVLDPSGGIPVCVYILL